MRVATWNINGMNARLEYLTHWLEAVRPDVVGLQELKMVEEKFPKLALKGLGYDAYVLGQKSWNGVAVLVRNDAFSQQAAVSQLGLPGAEEHGARLITITIGTLHFTTVYCPNGKSVSHADYAMKLAWFDALGAYLEGRRESGAAHVLCGDFNVVPAALDSWNEAAGGIFHTEEERKRMERIRAAGFVDLYRKRYPDTPGHTWWDYRGGAFHKSQGLRIDLIWCSEALASTVEDVTVERAWRRKVEGLTPSDHAPVWADLPWGNASAPSHES